MKNNLLKDYYFLQYLERYQKNILNNFYFYIHFIGINRVLVNYFSLS